VSRFLVSAILLCSILRADEIALLNLRVVEGEGSVYSVGSRATRGITVEITDELARPVPGATVSFMLPDSGSSGTFADGQRSAIAVSSVDGRATVWGMQWNKTPGTVEVRITALKGRVRAGTISTQYLSDKIAAPASARSGRLKKYLIIAGVAAGAAGAGMALGGRSSATTTAPAGVSAPPTVGLPTITVGRP
jgi:hypothetical protein